MNRKMTLAERLRDFIEGKGFYVVVLVCVAAVGLSGWYLVRTVSGLDELPVAPVTGTAQVEADSTAALEDEPVSAPAAITAPESPVLPEETDTPEPVGDPQTTTQPVEEPGEVADVPVPLVYTWPVKGEVLAQHSAETLAYDETMGDWRVHTGLDIAAAQGTNVLATAAGTVAAVDQHDLMGTTVVIDHGQGMTSSYSNLQALPTVEVGDRVYTGTVIGAVGATAMAESGRASHLHFELARDGVAVDPLDYLPGQ